MTYKFKDVSLIDNIKSNNHYSFVGDWEYVLHGDSLYSTKRINGFDPDGNRYGQRYVMKLQEYLEMKKYLS